MVAIYLSGTGNTKYCIEKLLSFIDNSARAVPIENCDAIEEIGLNDIIILGYPTQFSNAPYMVRDFINRNKALWSKKKVFCVVTMGAFSGDGAGCTARLLKKYGATILGGLHIKMPDSVCDSRLLKKTISENKQIVRQADKKIELAARKMKQGNYPQEGINFISHIIGLFGQRLWFYGKTRGYTKKLTIHKDCVGCGRCVSMCPMKNLFIRDGQAVSSNKCTMCYRCISQCPQKAITLLGSEVIQQCRLEKYL